ncbi:hypothetical protein [Dokdonella sp.]|uniref:hypothetical protein n=1 Tax=Dokdonella sp. TaxID=2291710 RepID=UPI003526F7A1
MKSQALTIAVVVALATCLPEMAEANSFGRCSNATLRGNYVFAASGFTRAPDSTPGTPWVPKAIVEIINFNGHGSLSTPSLTVANPFGDSGAVLQPPAGAPGAYQINPDCTGTVQFFDASGTSFSVVIELAGGVVKMIQTNPANNVFVGNATRTW